MAMRGKKKQILSACASDWENGVPALEKQGFPSYLGKRVLAATGVTLAVNDALNFNMSTLAGIWLFSFRFTFFCLGVCARTCATAPFAFKRFFP